VRLNNIWKVVLPACVLAGTFFLGYFYPTMNSRIVGDLAQKEALLKRQEQQQLQLGFSGRKILLVDSYHEGYEWSDGTVRGFLNKIKDSGVQYRIVRMDTKRHPDEAFKQAAGLKVKAVIDEYKPDVVVAADDNAFKYVVVGHYKNVALPFVFCGVNWEVASYGAPFANTTGILEVASIPELVTMLKEYAKGTRIGFLAADNETQRKEAEAYKQFLNIATTQIFVKNFSDWKKEYLGLQQAVDILLVGNYSGMEGWDNDAAKVFVEENTRIPTGTIYEFVAPYAMVGLAKVAEEHGEWAGEAALKILKGTTPSAIPVASSQKGKLFVNLRIANRLGVAVNPALLKQAEIIK